MLYYSYPQIVVEEVPGEISLALSISGCPLRCEGCHSTFTYSATYGKILTTSIIDKHLNRHITCILFYGGEWLPEELLPLFQHCKKLNLKICLYSGSEFNEVPSQLLKYLDYLKVGPYIPVLGGLSSPSTNQEFYIMSKGVIIGTHIFYSNPKGV